MKNSKKESNPRLLQVFSHDPEIRTPEELIEKLKEIKGELPLISSRKKGKIYNIPCSLDTETSSFWVNGVQLADQEKYNKITDKERRNWQPVAILVTWQIEIAGYSCIGRTWNEFEQFLSDLRSVFDLREDCRLIIYVHNLAYDFQFFRKHISVDHIFATGPRNPVRVISGGIEFRDSLILSGVRLEKMGSDLQKYKVEKAVGDWDYKLIRTPKTPLTDEEKRYCLNDVKVLSSYIQIKIEEEGDLDKIPMTNTGYVRRDCKRSTIQSNSKYRRMIRNLTITKEEYLQLKRTFQGGMTHGSCIKCGYKISNVGSYDFTSSYPAVMISEQYPMGRAPDIKITSRKDLEKNCHLYCCMFRVSFKNLREKITYEHILSESKCEISGARVIDNGRVVSADLLTTWVTEQDYWSLCDFYMWDQMGVDNFTRYYKQYLPRDLISTILRYYKIKTEYKGIPEKLIEYMISKGMLNSLYGMIVTDIVRSEEAYEDGEWKTIPPDIDKQIENYNNSKNRFLYYPWGVWVTAYARRNLIRGIVACDDRYIYSDTDSIKFELENSEEFRGWIDAYNREVIHKMDRAMAFHGFEPDAYRPKTIKGKEKPLGVWDWDGQYDHFKTLGSKRYLVEVDGEIKSTVAGAPKEILAKWLTDNFSDPFEGFCDGMRIPEEISEKLCHTYIDQEQRGWVTDYLGNPYEYDELSSCHLSQIPYTLGLADDYLQFLRLIGVSMVF